MSCRLNINQAIQTDVQIVSHIGSRNFFFYISRLRNGMQTSWFFDHVRKIFEMHVKTTTTKRNKIKLHDDNSTHVDMFADVTFARVWSNIVMDTLSEDDRKQSPESCNLRKASEVILKLENDRRIA